MTASQALRKAGVRSTHFYAASLGSIGLCIGLWIRAKTVDQDERVDLVVNPSKPGYVILDDTDYPGWNATVNGRPASILNANDNFRAVRVGTGGGERIAVAAEEPARIVGLVLVVDADDADALVAGKPQQ